MNNLIEQLKKNKYPFGLMSEEMQEKASRIGKGRDFQVYQFSAGGFKTLTGAIDGEFIGDETYRLRPDYADEPEIVECKITIGGCTAWMDKLVYTDEKVLEQGICEASVDPNFNGFGFEDGSWHDQPIKPVGPDGKLWSGNITVDDIVSGRVQILHATHVLFKRKKQE